MNRIIAIGLAAVLAVGVIAAIIVSYTQSHRSVANLVTVRGVIGSEKLPFFQDAEVVKVFNDNGYNVQIDTAGSRQIATTVDLTKYDFAFPAGESAGLKIQQTAHARTAYVPFFTPMAVATFKPIVDLLKSAGIATDQGGVVTLDMAKLLDAVRNNKRWSDIPGNTTYQTSKSILVTSTDVNKSNSAAMYLSIASYVANGNNVIQDSTQAIQVTPIVAPLFLKQGFTASSSEEPFNDYLTIGIGKDPLVMIYESQFLARQASKDGSITPDRMMIYPSPTVDSKHTLVPLSAHGDSIGRLLRDNPQLQALAVKYGFRTSDPAAFSKYLTSRGVPLPPQLVNVIDTPSYDVLEAMISSIGALQTQATTPK